MPIEKLSVVKLWKQHIRGSREKEIVKDVTILVCLLTKKVQEACDFPTSKIHLNTRVLKHLYDKKPAEEFEFVIHNLDKLLRYPDQVYKNKTGKRGSLCFVKKLSGHKYFCSIETTEELDGTNMQMICIVTAFRLRKEDYLEGYELLWSWKGDEPSS